MIDFDYWIGARGAEERSSFSRLAGKLQEFENEDVRQSYHQTALSDMEYLEEEDVLEVTVSENSEILHDAALAIEKTDREAAMFHGYNAGLGIEDAYTEIKNELEPERVNLNGRDAVFPAKEIIDELSSFFEKEDEKYHGFYLGLKAAEETF